MRLIDADELIKGRVENDPVVIAAKCQPTACDVDKVVEQLEQQAEQYHARANEYAIKGIDRQCEHMAGKACSYDYAIEIIKAGGVNEKEN